MSANQYQDRFERAFNQRIPRKVAHSFSEDQRAAIRTAFGGERWDGHPIDKRGTIPLLHWYFVFVAGSDNRRKYRTASDDRRKPRIFARIIGAVTMLVVVALLAVLLLAI